MKKLRREIRIIKKIKKITGWSTSKVIKRLYRAYKRGITPSQYLKNKCYKKKKKDLDLLGKKLTNRAKGITKTKKYKKINKKEASKFVDAAKEVGFTYFGYINNRCWEFTLDELKEYKEVLNDMKKVNNNNKEYYTKVVMTKTGWDYDYATERMNYARKLGYSSAGYIMHNLYLLKDEEIEKFVPKEDEEIKHKIEEKKREVKELKEELIKEKNWTLGRYRIEYTKAKVNCGCDEDEFHLYKLYDKSFKKQREFMTLDTYWKMKMMYCDFTENYIYFHQKNLFNEKFKKFVNRKWFVTEGLTYDKFLKNIKGLDTIAYKPIDQLQGKGFLKFTVNESEEQNKEVFDTIMKQGSGIVEEFIKQHPEMAKFSPKSCNSLRIVAMNTNGKCKILGAVFRTGVDNDFDNWSAGGIICGVNVKTGKVDTDGADKKGHRFTEHPISHIKYKGFQIPEWKKIVKAIEEASAVIKDMPYIGWDVAVTEKGEPEFIEGNHNHEIRILQSVYGILEDKGIKKVLKPYWKKEMELILYDKKN